MNGRLAKRIRRLARARTTTAPRVLGGWVTKRDGSLEYSTVVHAPGTYRREQQDLKRLVRRP